MLRKFKQLTEQLLWNTDKGHLHKRVERLENEIESLSKRMSNNPYLEHYSSLPYISPGITDRYNVGEKILWDRIDRPHYALGLWLATIQAARLGIPKLQVYEFGVASGAGLLNLCKIAELITASTDVAFDI